MCIVVCVLYFPLCCNLAFLHQTTTSVAEMCKVMNLQFKISQYKYRNGLWPMQHVLHGPETVSIFIANLHAIFNDILRKNMGLSLLRT